MNKLLGIFCRLSILAFAIILVCGIKNTRAQDISENMGVRIAPVEDIRTIKNDKTDIRVATTFILQCQEKNGASLIWKPAKNAFVLGLKGKSTIQEDITQDKAKNYADTIVPDAYAEVANKRHAWLWVPWERQVKWMKEAAIKSVLFRRDSEGFAFIGMISTPESETYILPRIENPLDLLPSEKQSFPFNSSTDIVVTDGQLGALVVRGTMEFLLLGQRMTPYINYGEGTHIVVRTQLTPVTLVDSDGHTTETKAGEFVFSEQKWSKVDGFSGKKVQAEKNIVPAEKSRVTVVVDDASVEKSVVTINAGKTGEPISKFIYGQFIEHLGRCIYGGIWAEMLEDRKFSFPITENYDPYRGTRAVSKDSPFAVVGASPWQIIGPADSVTMVKEDSFVGEHTPLIKPGGGIRQLDLGLVKNKKYVGYIYLKPQRQNTNVAISLVWGDRPGQQESVQTLVVASDYSKFPFEFTAGADTVKGKLQIEVSQAPCYVGTVSLMPADNIEGMRADTLELLKELNAPMYRWPGGNFVSGYDWRDGIGPRDKRPPRMNPAWTGVEHNDFGFNEFIRFCRMLNAEPLVTVNTGFGDAYSAAAQLEYANGSTDTLMGAARAKNGMTEPFNVRYWAIGNEMWGRWQLGYMSLNHYVRKHNWVVDKMREVDPDIVPIASGNAGRWSEGLLQNCSDHIDLIAEHFYCQEKPDLVEHIAQIADNIKRKVEFHKGLRKKLDTLKGKDIQVAMTEWNYWYGRHEFGELGTRYFHKDGLGIAKGLHEYFRNSDIIFLANYAQTVNVIGCIKTSKTAAAFATTGLVLKLYRNNFGTIPVSLTGDADPLDISAAWTEDRKALTIGVVNPTDKEHQITLDLKGVQLAGTGKLRLIAHSDPMAYNEPGKDPRVAIEDKEISNVSNSLTIPPLSASVYKLPVK